MGKPHPVELRQRIVAHVEAGNTRRSAATRFSVSVGFINDMVKMKRETGSLAPKPQGNPGIGKLAPHEGWVRAQVDAKGEITLDEMAARSKGDVIILDNLSSRKNVRAAEVLHDVDAWFLFLPPYSPDLNPTEMAFPDLKALAQKVAANTYSDLWTSIG